MFEFLKFYRGLSDRGFIIYPGKLTQAEAVRLNTIAGRMKISNKELLRQAAHIPVPKLPPRPPAGLNPA